MELRLVKRDNSGKKFSNPFPNEGQREFGYGKIKYNDNGFPLVVEGDSYLVSGNNKATLPSKMEEGYLVAYLKVFIDNEHPKEFCWDQREWDAYIVNDNGKTIEKL